MVGIFGGGRDGGVYRRVEFGYIQAVQYVFFVIDGLERDVVFVFIGVRVFGDDGYVFEGNGGYFQLGFIGYQFVFFEWWKEI